MTNDDRPELPDPAGPGPTASSSLDDILQRAVERQIAEQRALRESLAELRDAVRGTSSVKAPEIDTADLEESLRRAVETSASSLVDQVRDMRQTIGPQLERAASASQAVHGMTDELTAVRHAVASVSADIEGIAQALIDLNGGLRNWATGLDRSVETLQASVEDLRDAPLDTKRPRLAVEDGEAEANGGAKIEPRFEVMEERIKETAELSLYLSDQIEDLDRLMAHVGELPTKLEGVITQALRRTLTARSKLDKVAETALDDVLGELDEHLDGLNNALQHLDGSDEHLRKIELTQVELGSRLDSMQQTFIERLETLDAERRRGEEVLARAIDRSARGLDPRAFDSLTKPASVKKAKPKPAAKAKAQPKPKPKGQPKPRRKPKAKTVRRKRKSRPRPGTEPIPLPNDDDLETP